MKFIIVIILFAALAIYISGELQSDNEFISLYVNWVIILVLINLLVSSFIYLFTHSVKRGKGNIGIKGKIGRRGIEGDSDFCNFCQTYNQQRTTTPKYQNLEEIPVLANTFDEKTLNSISSEISAKIAGE